MNGSTSPARKPLVRVAARNLPRDGLWAVVLAGGEGVRLRPLVRLVHGDDRPKQYACLLDGQSLLQHTLGRVRRAIPPERTVVIAQQRHERYLADEFDGAPVPHVLRQPADRGTAPGILFPVHWIAWRDPGAVVVIFPSDHFVLGEEAFIQHVVGAAALARLQRERLILVGARPTTLETQYGWVEPGEPFDWIQDEPVCEAVRFWEKPDEDTARACWSHGGLWNTFVLAGTAETFLEVGRQTLPALSDRLARIEAFAGTPDEAFAVHQAYALAPEGNFSRAVLERCPPRLAVSRLPAGVTWSDWGTPDRVLQSLRAAGLEPPWLARVLGMASATAS
jgi:mannose-1-phosphate guanylyltransferase